MRGTKICTKPSNILQLAAIVIKINRHNISPGFEGEVVLNIFPLIIPLILFSSLYFWLMSPLVPIFFLVTLSPHEETVLHIRFNCQGSVMWVANRCRSCKRAIDGDKEWRAKHLQGEQDGCIERAKVKLQTWHMLSGYYMCVYVYLEKS